MKSFAKRATLLLLMVFLWSCQPKTASIATTYQPPAVEVQESNAPETNEVHRAQPVVPEPHHIYVEVGDMTVNGADGASSANLRANMRQSVLKSLDATEWIMTENKASHKPTKDQLVSNGNPMFFVKATVTKRSAMDDINIECDVSLILATYPDKSILGFSNYKSEMKLLPQRGETTPSPSNILQARDKCVTDLLGVILTDKTIPTLKTKSSP